DVIIPARYLNMTDPDELAGHCMEDIDSDFVSKVERGDVMVAGKNFGCGSSREHAPIAIKAAGIAAVIAESFARIFYRNAFNIGLPLIESGEAAAGISDGDEVEVNPENGVVRNLTTGEEYAFAPITGIAAELLEVGGLRERVRQQLAGQ
ncbi:MAG: 3-isopropylmalate dehydratase small subunit, partial [Armatimonadetes bacterium]|nr:3-isopropylmalate dehydratase small subunit [Armatimonadota bacterium]